MMLHEDRLKWKKGVPYIRGGQVYRRAEKAECLYCGSMFWRRVRAGLGVNELKRPKVLLFCSRRCASMDARKMWSSKRVTRRCVICRRLYRARPSDRNTTCLRPECTSERKSQVASETARARFKVE